MTLLALLVLVAWAIDIWLVVRWSTQDARTRTVYNPAYSSTRTRSAVLAYVILIGPGIMAVIHLASEVAS